MVERWILLFYVFIGSTPPIYVQVVRTGYVGLPPSEECSKLDCIIELRHPMIDPLSYGRGE